MLILPINLATKQDWMVCIRTITTINTTTTTNNTIIIINMRCVPLHLRQECIYCRLNSACLIDVVRLFALASVFTQAITTSSPLNLQVGALSNQRIVVGVALVAFRRCGGLCPPADSVTFSECSSSRIGTRREHQSRRCDFVFSWNTTHCCFVIISIGSRHRIAANV